ncbi:MAG: CidA/LrgA family protein [Polyangiaceae bacterium]
MPGLAILLAFNLLGLWLQHRGVPLPGECHRPECLFVACLFARIIKLEWVEPTANILLRNMLLFFAPVIVGAI